MDDPRIDPPLEAEERTTLTAFLDFNRETLALKCDGLTDDQLRERAAPPSSLSLLGIVRHRAEVERNWFRPVLAGEEMRLIYAPDMDWEGAFRDAATGDVSEAFSTWRGMRPRPRAGRGGPDPGDEGFHGRHWFSLRWVLNHMLEDYAGTTATPICSGNAWTA
jgi:hypothetical protein